MCDLLSTRMHILHHLTFIIYAGACSVGMGISTNNGHTILVSWDCDIPNIWKVIKFHGSNPPTRQANFWDFSWINAWLISSNLSPGLEFPRTVADLFSALIHLYRCSKDAGWCKSRAGFETGSKVEIMWFLPNAMFTIPKITINGLYKPSPNGRFMALGLPH